MRSFWRGDGGLPEGTFREPNVAIHQFAKFHGPDIAADCENPFHDRLNAGPSIPGLSPR